MSSKLDRIVQMDTLIRSGSYPTVATFTHRFEVSARTVHADLAYLRERLGAPLKHDRTRNGYGYTDPTWVLPHMIATQGELLAFLLSADLAHRYLGTTFEQPLRSAIQKLARTLPEELQVDLAQLARHYSFGAGATVAIDPTLFLDLDRAVRDQRPVDVFYYTISRHALTERTLHPYRLHNVQGSWQIIAYDSYRQEVRTFALEQIRRWTVQHHERFTWLPDFSIDAYLASQFITHRVDTPITFAVWFDPYQAEYIRARHWHATQEPLEEHPDGSVTLRFTAGAIDEVKRWVLGFGAHARALEPPDLCDAVQAELQAALKHYQN
jgi:predicted DNA-binding transcriptional regulator YafY